MKKFICNIYTHTRQGVGRRFIGHGWGGGYGRRDDIEYLTTTVCALARSSSHFPPCNDGRHHSKRQGIGRSPRENNIYIYIFFISRRAQQLVSSCDCGFVRSFTLVGFHLVACESQLRRPPREYHHKIGRQRRTR